MEHNTVYFMDIFLSSKSEVFILFFWYFHGRILNFLKENLKESCVSSEVPVGGGARSPALDHMAKDFSWPLENPGWRLRLADTVHALDGKSWWQLVLLPLKDVPPSHTTDTKDLWAQVWAAESVLLLRIQGGLVDLVSLSLPG